MRHAVDLSTFALCYLLCASVHSTHYSTSNLKKAIMSVERIVQWTFSVLCFLCFHFPKKILTTQTEKAAQATSTSNNKKSMALHIVLCLSTSFRSFRLHFLSLSQVKIVVEIPLMLMKCSRHDNCSEIGGITLRVVRLFEEMMRIQFTKHTKNRFFFSSFRHFSHWKWRLKVSWNSSFSSFASLAIFQVEGRQKRQMKWKKSSFRANKWDECLRPNEKW